MPLLSSLSPITSHAGSTPAPLRHSIEVSDGVYQVSLSIVNVFLIGRPGTRSGKWVLVDAGLYFSAPKILRAAEELYGPGSRPGAIILTHGHFDHVGALKELIDLWDVPVYAHPLEHPYLDGRSSYPPPDPGVGGGLMSLMSPLYPRGPINVGRALRELPRTGDVPHLHDWAWIHTPGHTPGHVSLFRPYDGTLIAGDAFVTTHQESLAGALLQPREIHGPPQYFTPNWEDAWYSIILLSQLTVNAAATGHGRPVYGPKLYYGLERLAEDFWNIAVPDHGRYVDDNAEADEEGVTFVPPRQVNKQHVAIAAFALVAIGGALLFQRRR